MVIRNFTKKNNETCNTCPCNDRIICESCSTYKICPNCNNYEYLDSEYFECKKTGDVIEHKSLHGMWYGFCFQDKK